MYNRSVILFVVLSSMTLGMVSLGAENGTNQPPVYAWIGCDGNGVIRSDVGKITITRIATNLPNCNGPKSVVSIPIVDTSSLSGQISITRVSSPLDMFKDSEVVTTKPKKNKILLDLSQRDIVNYRIEMIRQQQIQYANAIRSLRVRAGQSSGSHTNEYLTRNDAVAVTGYAKNWTPVRTGKVVVTDTRENTIRIDTSSGVAGYVGKRYLRNAMPADLVKIGQADIAYWTDIVHTNVAHRVNIRNNPWYGAAIVATIGRDIDLYRIATVDNWSEVQGIDGVIRGFIRSDFIVVDTRQLIEKKPILK